MKRFTRYVGWAVAALVLSIGAAVAWLKLHEDALVFATARRKLHVIKALPRDVERISVPGARQRRLLSARRRGAVECALRELSAMLGRRHAGLAQW
jgi:hypothetical protein